MTAPIIDRVARRLAGNVTRRQFAVGAAAGCALLAARRVSAGITAVCPPCGPGEICIDGACVIAVDDGCEAFGCPVGLQCVNGACIDPPDDPPPTPTPAPDDPPRRRKRRRRRRPRPGQDTSPAE